MTSSIFYFHSNYHLQHCSVEKFYVNLQATSKKRTIPSALETVQFCCPVSQIQTAQLVPCRRKLSVIVTSSQSLFPRDVILTTTINQWKQATEFKTLKTNKLNINFITRLTSWTVLHTHLWRTLSEMSALLLPGSSEYKCLEFLLCTGPLLSQLALLVWNQLPEKDGLNIYPVKLLRRQGYLEWVFWVSLHYLEIAFLAHDDRLAICDDRPCFSSLETTLQSPALVEKTAVPHASQMKYRRVFQEEKQNKPQQNYTGTRNLFSIQCL